MQHAVCGKLFVFSSKNKSFPHVNKMQHAVCGKLFVFRSKKAKVFHMLTKAT
jgi:hypothetical protein